MTVVIYTLAVIGLISLIIFVILIIKVILPIIQITRGGSNFAELTGAIESSSILSVSDAFESVTPALRDDVEDAREMDFWDKDLEKRGFQKGSYFFEPSLNITYQVHFHQKGYVALVGFGDDLTMPFLELFAESDCAKYVTVSGKSKVSAVGILSGEERIYRPNAEFDDLWDTFEGCLIDKVIKPFLVKDFFERYNTYRIKQAVSLIQDTDFLDEFDEIYAEDQNNINLSSYSELITKACEYEFAKVSGWSAEKWMIYHDQIVFVHDRSLEQDCGIESEELSLSEVSKHDWSFKYTNREKYQKLTGAVPIAKMNIPVGVDVYHKLL